MNALAWLIGLGAAAAYAWAKPSKPLVKRKPPRHGHEGHFDDMPDLRAGKRMPPPDPSQPKPKSNDALRATLDLRVSGFEKMFAGDMKARTKKAATKLAVKLPSACPFAPVLTASAPTEVKVKNIDAGYRITIVWPAISRGEGPVAAPVLDCMKALLRNADKDFDERLIRMSAELVRGKIGLIPDE